MRLETYRWQAKLAEWKKEMRVLNSAELAELLFESHYDITDEDFETTFGSAPITWLQLMQAQREEYRDWAERILDLAKVAMRP